MKQFVQRTLLAATLFVSMTSSAAILHDGGMSGGGGDTTVANPAGPNRITEILFSSRQSLYLYFNKLSAYPYDMDPKIDAIKNKMQDVILSYRIYASIDGCQDKFGNDVDGSMYSPNEKSICISLKNLGAKLAVDNAASQTIALVAHEYSHLLGYDEEDAVFVQNWVLQSYSGIANYRADELLKQMEQQLYSINSFVVNMAEEKNQNWNVACYLSNQLDESFGQVLDRSETGILSFFNSQSVKAFNSFAAKVIALKEGTCRFSDFYPAKDSYKVDYPKYFNGQSQITDEEFAKADPLVSGPFLGTVMIKKIDSLTDALAEAKDISKYINQAILDVQTAQNLAQLPIQ